MKRLLFHILRQLSLLTGMVWLLACLWNWWFAASYAQCGPGIRLCGFITWGILLSLVPIIFALPPRKTEGNVFWGETMPAPLIVVLLGWSALLLFLISDPPAACADGDILALVGLLWDFAVYGSAILLAVLTHLLQKICRRISM